MPRLRGVVSLVLIAIVSTSATMAGTYSGTAVCGSDGDCAPGIPTSVTDPKTDDRRVRPFAVTHPLGYDGTGGVIRLNVCMAMGDEAFSAAAARAIATWNALVPTTENCGGVGCSVWEDSLPVAGTVDAESVIVHELGHCAFGLQHPERPWDAADDGFWESTSFTRSYDVANPPLGIQVGGDFIRGTLDDLHQQAGGGIPDSVHWFRIQDNNPFAIDSTVIDASTYSRSITANLPAGHSWAANGNRRTAEELGFPSTQAVMYGLLTLGEQKRSLTADEVNMVKMASTGVDFMAGTADDYTVELAFSCNDPIAILIDVTGGLPAGVPGRCGPIGVDYSFPQNPLLARHFTVEGPPDDGGLLFIRLNEDLMWDLGVQPVFVDGFESGNTSEWDVTVP